ncbi:HNH endonuclease [Patescibacteria group bacterium]|jgi:5-methylcytosine-specific restriction endonuclease McrA|nr:HNH endonuclease [Patescibacteria group bacterium]
MAMTPEERRERERERCRKWKANNPDKIKAYSKKYRSEHLEQEREKCRAWRKNNPDKDKAITLAWRAANRERMLATCSAYNLKRKEAMAEYRRNMYASDPEKYRARAREYAKSNPEKVKRYREEHREERRIRKYDRIALENKGGKLSKDIIQKLWKVQKGRCPVCKADLKETGYHLDHIVPLKPRTGEPAGKHEDANMQLTCPTCNLKKFNKNPIQFMQEMGYLL